MPAQFGAPGVYTEEISGGPRPVTMAGTTETGFVGVVTIPKDFFLGKLSAPGKDASDWRPLMPLPKPEPTDAISSWQTALAFLPFANGKSAKRNGATSPAPKTFHVDGKASSLKDVQALIKGTTSVKVFKVDGSGKEGRSEVNGTQARLLTAIEAEGKYQIEGKGLATPITVEAKAGSKGKTEDNGTSPEMLELADLIQDALGDGWDMRPRQTPEHVEVDLTRSGNETATPQTMQVRFRRSLLAYREVDEDLGEKAWVLNSRADRGHLLATLAAEAMVSGIPYTGDLQALVDDTQSVSLEMDLFQEKMSGGARRISSIDGFESWLVDFSEELFVNLHSIVTSSKRRQSETLWRQLHDAHKRAWVGWVSRLQGMLRLELAVRGFFTNGGQVADLAIALQSSSSLIKDKQQFLKASFDPVSQLSMLTAPGLDRTWQEAILTYGGATGRSDCFAVLETPRYFLTRSENDREWLGKDRWMKGGVGYEQPMLEFRPSPDEIELRNPNFANDELLSTVVPRDDRGFGAAYGPWLLVENPRATGPHDRYIVAPPSGHVAGMIAGTDLSPGGGVFKAPANEVMSGISGLVTSVSDSEQGPLNSRSINMIRHRPFAGIRCWGARTVASDPLWRYINVRRLFLMVERSIRDAIGWAVFLPNTNAVRSDLRSTIVTFLLRLYTQGALDGATAKEAFSVRCDKENNPDSEVREGILTVDVSLRPVYPSEFIRLRFRQSPMMSELSES